VKIFKAILNPFSESTRFNRYYGNLIQLGEGYPTADEAKQDLRRQEQARSFVGWMR